MISFDLQTLFAWAESTASFQVDIVVPEQCNSAAELSGGTILEADKNDTHTLFSGNNSVKINTPKDFYSEDIEYIGCLYVNDYFSSQKPAPLGRNFIGKTYEFFFFDLNGNEVTTLLNPVTFIFTYTNADVSGIDENTIAPYYWNSNNSSWQLITGATIDITNNKITFSMISSAAIALFGEPLEEGREEKEEQSKSTKKSKSKSSSTLSTGECNDDGIIDFRDLSIMLYWFGKSSEEASCSDLNDDGKINYIDVSILLYRWGK